MDETEDFDLEFDCEIVCDQDEADVEQDDADFGFTEDPRYERVSIKPSCDRGQI